ncbi:MAG TPA: hypothetical protein VFL62_26555 [Bradyrhizobium sp.]|uniref:hypothetical protein n=1 Tax=Bradyrhizobium sp. TaxID=376 RepID=UPI002D80C3A2|nr:hypothetical protein [Bradyrhizobium sp.]HET7889809.1 hypothetical protein [Bradyrhizobium sp.]
MGAKRILISTLVAAGLSVPLTLAPASFALPEDHVPHLADIMGTIQARHIKIWYAGKAANWELAKFEARQLEAGLVDAAMFYAGIPVSNVTTMAKPLHSLDEAIAAKDGKQFSKAYSELTADCNGCHASMARPFVVIRVPTGQQPFGDQLFTPQGKQ